MEQLIPKQAAIDTLKDLTANGTKRGMICGEDAVHRIEMLPPVQPDNQVHLCDSCSYTYPECPSVYTDVIFGNGIGNDNICACSKYTPSAQPEQHYDEWCDSCKEYDKEKHSCPRWNRVIRQTLVDAQPEPCEDAVSKETILKFLDGWMSALDENCHNQSVSDLKIIKRDFENLPTVTPKQRTGKWERHYSRPNVYADLCWHCSACGYYHADNWMNKFKYCPNCGAKMVGGGERMKKSCNNCHHFAIRFGWCCFYSLYIVDKSRAERCLRFDSY